MVKEPGGEGVKSLLIMAKARTLLPYYGHEIIVDHNDVICFQVMWILGAQSITVQTFNGPMLELEGTGLVLFQIFVTDSYQSNV